MSDSVALLENSIIRKGEIFPKEYVYDFDSYHEESVELFYFLIFQSNSEFKPIIFTALEKSVLKFNFYLVP